MSISDAAAAVSVPSKLSTGQFQFATVDGASPMLHVSAPGYAPLGDPTSPGVGIAMGGVNSGPLKLPGAAPMILPGGARWNTGERLAIMLTPNVGCGRPRSPSVLALSVTVHELVSGSPITGLTVALSPDPGSPTAADPGPIVIGAGTFSAKSLSCGTYDLTVDAPGHAPLGAGVMTVTHHAATADCDGALASGAIAYGTIVNLELPTAGFNRAPVIQWIKVPSTMVRVGEPFTISAGATDPDGDPLTGSITSTDPHVTCSPTSAPGAAELTAVCVTVAGVHTIDGLESESDVVTYTEPSGGVATQTITIAVLPPMPGT